MKLNLNLVGPIVTIKKMCTSVDCIKFDGVAVMGIVLGSSYGAIFRKVGQGNMLF